ncbi:hypothetical protein [Glutamicibacter ardleyensis]|uniref:hypothetical protein n=1 Tax=Glutamicibacter ardleyensis TaxID=225894 RepID=UPI003FD13D93
MKKAGRYIALSLSEFKDDMASSTSPFKRPLVISSMLASGLLLLSGCINDPSPTSDSAPVGESETVDSSIPVYQFDEARVLKYDDQSHFVAPDSKVTIKLSDELKALVPDDTKIDVERFDVEAKSFSTGVCILDIGVTYTEGGKDRMLSQEEDIPYSDAEFFLDALVGSGDDAMMVDALPEDGQVENYSRYVTKDYSEIKLVDDCSEDMDEDIAELSFILLTKDKELGYYAHADLTVMGNSPGAEETPIFIRGSARPDVSATGEWMPF